MKHCTAKEIFSIPNLMGYFRILLIPVFCVLYLNAESQRDFLLAGAVVLLSSLTDLFDGMVARRFNMVTQLGKVLDPVADKLTHAALAICLAVRYPLMWLLITLMVLKEGYMAIMGAIFLKKGRMIDGAMWFGKVCTATLFVGLIPSTTPLAMTMPMSRPRVRRMKHSARNPAMVVRLEPKRDRKAATIAWAMASRLSS